MAPQPPRAAAIYCRISSDRNSDRLGVDRQEKLCRDLAVSKRWTVAEVYTDNDLSAYSGKPRPAYQRMLADLTAGTRDAVLVVDTDRLTRTPAELETFINLADRHGVALANAAGDLDLATSDGRFKARIMGAVARQESEKKSERQRRKAAELAYAGKISGGGTRPFGYQDDRTTIRPDEAALIREATQHILSGGTIGSLLNNWHERDIRSVTGGHFRTTSLRRLLRSPRIAGLREYQGELLRKDGQPVQAVWPAIITGDEHERLVAILDDPARRRGGRPRTYLLSGGLGVCGLCEGRLYARPKAGGRRGYVCPTGPVSQWKGCGKIHCLADPLEAEVRDQVLAALDSPALHQALRGQKDDRVHAELLARLHADEAALDRLVTDHYDGLVDRARFLDTNQRLTDRVEATRRALAHHTNHSLLDVLPEGADALRATWDTRDVEWRRLLLSAVLEAVVVGPAVKGRNFFDPDRVTLRWRY